MRKLITIMAMLSLAACTTTTVTPVNKGSAPALRQVNVISLTKEKINFEKSDTFAWQTQLLAAGSEAAKMKQGSVTNLEKQVEGYFNKKGYKFNKNLLDADYFLVGVLLLEGHEESSEHSDLLIGLDPGMHPSEEYGVGTLLIGVRDVKNSQLVWRGAVQIFLAGEDSELTLPERTARIDNAIKMLMDGLFDYTK
ncbi:MAG: DUF4136 domain-containing protein [Sinobacterium sp.]|nr:DUF4136 domain-containing protein [Sinobacterium sp.]